MFIVCLDLEGVLVPEIWINVAEKTGIKQLRLTTRDLPDYDELMRRRLAILKEHSLKLTDIQQVISGMRPLEGGKEFLDTLRVQTQVIILSDTFTQFASPLMEKLDWPTLFCNTLIVDADGTISDYRLRIPDGKMKAVHSLRAIGYDIIAAGDSYNDLSMLKEANHGVLFRPPESIIEEYPELKAVTTHADLLSAIQEKL